MPWAPHPAIMTAMAKTANESTDLVLLHPGREACVDAAAVRALVEQHASVAAIQVPVVQADGGLDRDEITGCHHQCGVDLARAGGGLRMRDILLLRLPRDEDGRSRMALVHVWNTEASTYDIDAVRIPWDQIPGPRDKRNNPMGKNPCNVWSFHADLDGESRPAQRALFGAVAEPECGSTTSLRVEADAIRRLVRCHSGEGAAVHVAAPDPDVALIEQVVHEEGRLFAALPEGEPDPFEPIPQGVESPPPLEGSGDVIEKAFTNARDGSPLCTATARFVDCREGLASTPAGRVTHAVTSPPYNIGYDPFNVAVRDRATGELKAPTRQGYEDALSAEQYAGLLAEVFAGLDTAAHPDRFELFLDIKNNYQGARCNPPFYMLRLMPERWRLLDLLVWRYDISFDPARKKYKPVYEWVIRVGFGDVAAPRQPMADWYVPILKGNSRERRELAHPAMFPRPLVHRSLQASGRTPDLVVDPFLGSGTTLAACAEMGVDSLGFELMDEFSGDIHLRLEWTLPGSLVP